MSLEEVEVLRRRAEAFLRNAEYLLKGGEWDLTVFNLEQYCQLVLKYKLLLKTGSYPRTHSLRRLIRELAKHNPKLQTLVDDEQMLHYVARLEEAYITSRYMPYSYEEKEAQSLYRFVVDKFKRLVDEAS
ncbi:MAG: HEPN domain-containing protein [Candidatus Nezhaarchaeales archaeon]